MIERHVYIRLLDGHRGERDDLAARIQAVIQSLPDVMSVSIGTPADEHASVSWDIAATVRFESAAALEGFRTDRTHRQLVAELLKPRMSSFQAWNFAVAP